MRKHRPQSPAMFVFLAISYCFFFFSESWVLLESVWVPVTGGCGNAVLGSCTCAGMVESSEAESWAFISLGSVVPSSAQELRPTTAASKTEKIICRAFITIILFHLYRINNCSN